MSGIAGAIYADNARPACRELMAHQTRRIARRGPDGSDIWSAAGVHLLHSHRDTTGFRENNLGEDTAPLRIVGDIRLDNRPELAGQLALSGPAEPSDVALVLAAYRRWGRDCCQHLVGDFAFALWDVAGRELFCARDPLGVKPLFYRAENRGLLFCSELAGVTQGRGAVDESRIAGFLTGVADNAAATALHGALRLEPGHWLHFADGRCTTERYWTARAEPQPRIAPASAFRTLLEQAVTARLRGNPAIGAMLSGGLDSSAIVGVAAPHFLQHRLKTYSFGYPETPGLDESRYVAAVLDAHELDPAVVNFDDLAPLDGLDTLADGESDLLFGPGLPKMGRLFGTAHAAGSRVLLDGHGGDEVVSHGFGRLAELARAGRWLALYRELGGLGQTFGQSPNRLFLHYFTRYGPGRRASGLLGWMRTLRPPSLSPEPLSILRPEFARSSDMVARHAAWAGSLKASRTSQFEHHRWSITAPGVGEAFEALDRTGVQAGIELRFPFFDVRLVQFALGLPASESLQNGWSRSILRRAMQDILPETVQWRRDKIDFSPELRHGLVRHHRDLLLAVARDHDGIGAYVDLARLDRAIAQLLDNAASLPPGDLFMIWRCVFLSMWLHHRRALA